MLFKRVSDMTHIRRGTLSVALTAALFGCGGGTTTNTSLDVVDTTQPATNWVMVWSDEFDGNAINANNWTHEVNCLGGGNQEKQCYTDDPANSFVADGMLNIVAMPTPADAGLPLPYTSARLNSKNKADFRYGRFEMRAKLPFGQGSWPAFWMLSTDEVYGTWPMSGEIDILEAVNLKTLDENGVEFNSIFGTLHYGNLFPNNVFSGKDYALPDGQNPADDFHVYAVEWQEGEIRWYVDGFLYATQRQSVERTTADGTVLGLSHRGWFLPQFDPGSEMAENIYGPQPFDQEFHFILNLAVGGNFPENTNNGGIDASAFENGQTFQIDYVRVYECSSDPATGRGCESVRAGYDDLEDALVEGQAPIPSPPVPPSATPITIFADSENPGWPIWDNCCGPAESEVVMDDAEHGSVVEFRILDNSGTVLGFNSREAESGSPFNATAFLDDGFVRFEMKIESPGAANAWIFKAESNNDPSQFFEVNLNTSLEGVDPVVGQWQTYTFPISDLAASSIDISAIDVLMIFPAWQTGEGTVYRVDNVFIGNDSGASFPELTIFDDTADENWAVWDDCCGPASSAIVMDDADRGEVVEFEILDGSGTVLGFNSREGIGGGVPFNATPLVTEGVLQFDMKIVSPGAASTWLVKVEGNNLASPAFEVNLNTSNEGADPVVGEWQTYTFPVSALLDAGVDITAIDVVLIFPAWQTGEGAQYRIDNVRIYNPNASGGPVGPLLAAFVDGENPDWPLWDDCCGPAESEVVMDDAEHGAVAEFRVLDNSGTVLGFNTRSATGGTDMPFDATSIIATGVLQFEMKVVSPGGATNWLVKIEGNDIPAPAFEVPLNTSNEGMDPVTGEWQTYTFPVTSLLDAGVDISAIDVIMIFPAWATGEGAVYRVDNVFIGNPSDISGDMSGGGSSDSALTLFADQVNEAWPLWDCLWRHHAYRRNG